MVDIKTYCGDCCFYNNIEKKCEHNILDIFKNDGSNIIWDKNGPTVSRVCQYKRTQEWYTKNNITDLQYKIKLCKDEVYLKGTIILLTEDLDLLKKSIEKLNTVKNIKNFKTIIIYKNIKHIDILTVCGNNLNSEYKIINNINNTIEYQIYKSLSFAKNGYLFIIDCSKNFDKNIIDKVNYIVNIKMLRLLHIVGSNGLHESVSMIHLYKWLKGDLQENFYHKLKDISEQEKSNEQVFTWKEVNEQYSS